METLLTEFFDSKYLNHYNEEIKQVIIKSPEDYKKLTDPYDIVINVDIKNIENCVGIAAFNIETTTESDETKNKIEGTISIYAKLEKENRFYSEIVLQSVHDVLDSFLKDFDKNLSIRNSNILILIDNHASLMNYSDVVSLYVNAFISGVFHTYENLDLMVGCSDDMKRVEDIFLEKKKGKKKDKKQKK